MPDGNVAQMWTTTEHHAPPSQLMLTQHLDLWWFALLGYTASTLDTHSKHSPHAPKKQMRFALPQLLSQKHDIPHKFLWFRSACHNECVLLTSLSTNRKKSSWTHVIAALGARMLLTRPKFFSLLDEHHNLQAMFEFTGVTWWWWWW